MTQEVFREGEYFVMGDEAYAMGAVAAGCTFCTYYPITPVSECLEAMAMMLPKMGGIAIQMEDEIASIHAASGASVAGRKAMTASSGPGLSLKMDGLGWAIMNEIPLVIIDVQRAGPSNGVATNVGQGDIYQTRYGTHGGNYEMIVISPSSVQEGFDMMFDAFNLAEVFRSPVILLTDEIIAHTREKLVVPSWEELEARRVARIKPNGRPEDYAIFQQLFTPEAMNVPFPAAGDGYGICVAPYTHDEKGYPSTAFKHQDLVAKRLVGKIRANVDKIVKFESMYMDDAKLVIASFGSSARPALSAVRQLREDGLKVGYWRLITIWPFPDKQIRELVKGVDKVFVVECNIDGQLVREVQRACGDKAEAIHIGKAGVEIHTPEEILGEVRRRITTKEVV